MTGASSFPGHPLPLSELTRVYAYISLKCRLIFIMLSSQRDKCINQLDKGVAAYALSQLVFKNLLKNLITKQIYKEEVILRAELIVANAQETRLYLYIDIYLIWQSNGYCPAQPFLKVQTDNSGDIREKWYILEALFSAETAAADRSAVRVSGARF